jgi:non-canonical (house-cleaning) NTP pyrophosphatase
MNIWKLTPVKAWATRGLSAAALVSGLLAAQPVQADDPAVITAYAPGAPESAWIAVQWQNTDATWHTVDGWQGDLDYTSSGVAFKQWAVASSNYGAGPFRWVVYTEAGGVVWAASDSFALPDEVGENVEQTLAASTATTTTTVSTTATEAAATTTATSSTELSAWTENLTFDTAGGTTARITMQIAGVSPTAHAVVQYLDAAGAWQNVEGWQTTVTINAYGVAVVQWGVAPANFGQGSFRWAILGSQGGSVVGVSPVFDLPTQSGVDLVMHLSD